MKYSENQERISSFVLGRSWFKVRGARVIILWVDQKNKKRHI
ncbi:hypothetical protein [Desulfocicer vacuolatum]|nr:hypothetical protein [Desulfocicer vacuolatum]